MLQIRLQHFIKTINLDTPYLRTEIFCNLQMDFDVINRNYLYFNETIVDTVSDTKIFKSVFIKIY